VRIRLVCQRLVQNAAAAAQLFAFLDESRLMGSILSANTITIDHLKSAFGWDGRDPFWLQDADFSQHVVQLKLAFETYDNKTRLKVQYVDAEDATPSGVPQADDAARRAIGTRLGSKFRANAGGTPAAAPKPNPGSRPAPPKPASAAAPSAPPQIAAGITMQQAWKRSRNPALRTVRRSIPRASGSDC
jgi:hypothetical protein